MGVKKTMKMSRLIAGTLSLSAAVLTLAATASAQGSSDGKPMMMTTTSGQNVVMVGPMTSAADKEKVRWAFYNADRASVNRIKAMGFSETNVKEILNLSLRTGLDVDYITRRVKVSGYSFRGLAEMYGVNPKSLDEDIPGFNADAMAILGDGSGMSTMAGSPTTTSGSSAMVAKGDIIDVAASDPQLSTFVAAVRAAGLTDMLKGSSAYTIFAPTNGAFAKLPAGTLDDLLKPENKEKLVAILQNHVVSGKVMSRDIMGMSNPSMPRTAGGGSLTVKTTAPVMINDAGLVQADVLATNGVIHLVDTVLLPTQ